ncbi:MAG: 16S rRNA (cytosine(1402)-N(4))-methyltransferase RsmH [Nitrospiraceae bacterium]
MYTAAKKWDEVDVNGPSRRLNPNSHVPVLVEEVLSWLACRPGGRYLDCTVGQGGLASSILDLTGPDGSVIGIDQDEEAIAAARNRLEPFAGRARLIRGNFRQLKQHLSSVGLSEVDGVVFDLGMSSAQLDQPDRGFSFLDDGPLDMRMDRRGDRTAAELLNRLGETELADLLYRFGEERYSRRIARAVVRARDRRPLQTTFDLLSVIRDAVPAFYRHGRLHYATRTFQALRIAVNRELEVLEGSLRDAADVLAPGGRLCVISFHSLEDRIAKQTFRALSHGQEPCLATLTKKPCVPSEQERRENPRARSAKLRVAERLPHRRCP